MRVRISEVRAGLGVSQKQLAETTGISAPYLSQIESGKRKLNVTQQVSIAKALGVDPSVLVDFSASDSEEVERVQRAMLEANAYERRLMLQIAEMVEARLGEGEPAEPCDPPG